VAIALTFAASGCTTPSRPLLKPTTASSSSSAATCGQVGTDLLAAVQQYISVYDAPAGSATSAPAPDDTKLQAAVQTAQEGLRNNNCDVAEFRRTFQASLSGITTHGPVAKAVLLRLAASITGATSQKPTTIVVQPSDDLPKRIAALAPGSTVRLAPGTFRLDASLALLDGIIFRGAASNRTKILSSAGDAAVLVLTDARVEFDDLTLSHAGKATGDLIVGGPSTSLVLTRVRVTGALANKTSGGNAVIMTSRAGASAGRGTSLEVTSSTFDNNAAAGILLSGAHIASIRNARFESNQNCGVCFSGSSTGAVRNSTFVNNRVGIAVLDKAKPALTDDVFTGGLFGLQASADSTPVVQRAKVSGATRAAMIFADRAAGRVDASTCTNVPYGIVVSPKALPLLGTNECMVSQGK
jgi:hypothetical protein